MINIFQPVGSSPTTTEGDLIVRGASSDGRLAIGANATVLTSNGTTATWAAAAGGGLTIGTTTIASGTSTRLLFDASGVVSETDGATWDATNKALTVGGATVTTSKPILDLSQTWNAGAVTFTGLKLNVTNTASAAASLLMDLQVGGASKAYVDKAGQIVSTNTGASTIGVAVVTSGQPTVGFGRNSSIGGLDLYGNGTTCGFNIANNVTTLASSTYFGWTGSNITQPVQVSIHRIASGVFGIRGSSSSAGAALSFIEQTAPSAPSANGVYIYAQDNGAGKTQLMALFASGVAQQVAIEP